jgi:hypothetical protein
MTISQAPTITDVISDFLASAPSLEDIIAFRLPEAVEQRALELLELNRRGLMTAEERAEMEKFGQMGHLMTRVKAKGRLHLHHVTKA